MTAGLPVGYNFCNPHVRDVSKIMRSAEMILASSATLRKIKHLVMASGLVVLWAVAPVLAGSQKPALPLPSEFGEVIYQREGEGDSHVYIICQSHRSARTGDNGANTVGVQSEVYRIGEWLIRNKNVGLLLPEGYFRRGNSQPVLQPVAFEAKRTGKQKLSFDDDALRAILSDTSRFANADKLLSDSYDISLQQVEDRELYHSILDFLFRTDRKQGLDANEIRILSHLQEKRSAVMLQAIPAAINREMQQGGISQPKAIFTIGLAHLSEVMRFLNEGKIEISSPQPSNAVEKGELKLLQENYGITVILPRSLTTDQEAIRIANLDELVKSPSYLDRLQ
jgi:hypothetical protein